MGAENPLLQFEPGLMIWTIIVFLLTLVVLGRIAWKPLLQNLDAREKKIHDALTQAEKAREEAEAAIAEARRESREALRRSEEMVAEAKADAERLRERMITEAKVESQRVVQDGLRQLEAEQRLAMQEIRRHAADLAIQAASKLIRSSLDERQQRELVDRFLDEVPSGSKTVH